jgi:DNA/RNA-binding domain of Phe-tRNA-synthetase-like protein
VDTVEHSGRAGSQHGEGSASVGLAPPCQTWHVALFRYDEAIIEAFPAVVGGVLLASGITNGATPPALAAAFRDEQAAVRERLGDRPLSELPTLAAWRRVFRSFGVDPTQYRSAAEALLRRLIKQGELPSIDTLVDVANLVSIRYALPVAVFDRRAISGGTTVRFARGDERWADLGASTTEHPARGEVIFADEADRVSARRWCWRQSAASATHEDTTEILVTIEGHHPTAGVDVVAALDDLEMYLRMYATPVTLRRTVLDAAAPTFV